MRGIALSTVILFFIAVVSIIILIVFIGQNMSPSLTQGYCSIMQGFLGVLPLPEHLKPSLPLFCSKTAIFQKVVSIESGYSGDISYDIAAYSLACWKETGEINKGQDVNCYELVLKRVDNTVTESMVRNWLPEDYNNITRWDIGNISTAKSVGIYYDSSKKLIVIV